MLLVSLFYCSCVLDYNLYVASACGKCLFYCSCVLDYNLYVASACGKMQILSFGNLPARYSRQCVDDGN